jgi:hypothetical protein
VRSGAFFREVAAAWCELRSVGFSFFFSRGAEGKAWWEGWPGGGRQIHRARQWRQIHESGKNYYQVFVSTSYFLGVEIIKLLNKLALKIFFQ